ncbi:hypothetical protein B296_00003572 [Ensete ventricosum]|uniref:RING-CH-type domain-containing protein n=1 Tax=Ensete ventricosum TaxID=4639 RepID=A0A427AYL9_ENSVE|nr:hypothetical protein B296_00003572 [Ensete ventricosum]
MGDHLALVVDDLLARPTLEAAAGNRKHAYVDVDTNTTSSSADPAASAKLKECRICHEEDQDSNMEIPCSCSGSLKYAHRVCVQRWCNQKGDTMCEICLQQFNPGYTTLPKLYDCGSTPMDFRSWEISAQDLRDTQFITMFPSDHGAIDSGVGYRDYSRTSSTFCGRSVTVILMVLLVLRHALPLLISEDEQYSITLFSMLVLKTAGVLLTIFFILRIVSKVKRRRRHRVQHRTVLFLENVVLKIKKIINATGKLDSIGHI